jgi:hypothetical protein
MRARALHRRAGGHTPRHWDRASVPPEPSCLPETHHKRPALLTARPEDHSRRQLFAKAVIPACRVAS